MEDNKIGPDLLERWALHYLGRYASSAENLRRVLMRKARRGSPEEAAAAAAMRARLTAKGVSAADVANAVSGVQAAAPDPDLAAACTFARRRRLGPFRRATADHARELGAFARAGFSRRIAEAVLSCTDVAAVEALARGERD